MIKMRHLILLCIILILQTYTPVFAKSKAQYLFDFSHFITWPDSAFTEETFNICLYGGNPFGDVLQELVENKKIQGKSVKIKQQTSLTSLSNCHILYIHPNKKNKIAAIVKAIANNPVLTVSEFSGFIDEGGIINFIQENEVTRFEMNVKIAKKVKLKISSKLIRLATKVIK